MLWSKALVYADLSHTDLKKLRRVGLTLSPPKPFHFSFRCVHSAWLPEHTDEITHRMNKRISMITGLSMDTAEDLQVGNYGIGGFYAPHFDFGRVRSAALLVLVHVRRISVVLWLTLFQLSFNCLKWKRRIPQKQHIQRINDEIFVLSGFWTHCIYLPCKVVGIFNAMNISLIISQRYPFELWWQQFDKHTFSGLTSRACIHTFGTNIIHISMEVLADLIILS